MIEGELSMSIEVGKIEFGEIDAKNEVLEQEKFGSSIFHNSFLIPPGTNLDKLITGAHCFIYGQKGCGKTSLLLYTRGELEKRGAKTKTILFKSGITERERQKIAGSSFVLVDQNEKISVEYDYKINWLWYVYRNILRLLTEDQVYKNWDIAVSLKKLMSVYGEVNTSLLGDISTKSIKVFARAALSAGPLTAEIGAEIEAISKDNENSDIEIIDIVEKYISEIVLYPTKRCVVLFDELELFWNRRDQRERDLFLIRDLLYAVSRVNHNIGSKNVSLGVIASVRSEVLAEVNRVGPEISRDVADRGVRVHWNVKSQQPTQPILQIIERKINASEVEDDNIPTDDIWSQYFPARIFGRDIKQYLLDISMFKPRNLVSLLSQVKGISPEDYALTEDSFNQAQAEFSKRTWTEVEEGLLGEFDADRVSAIKSILSTFKPIFNINDIRNRVRDLSKSNSRVRKSFNSDDSISEMLEYLYRLGAVGNFYHETEGQRRVVKNRWMFRDYYEPLMDKPFEVHESIRKELQLSFRNS